MMKFATPLLVAVSVLGLAACSEKSQQAADNALAASGNELDNAASDAGNVIDNTAMAMTPTPTPQEFVDTAAKSDAYEIAAAKLAATNGASAGVKEFALKMIAAHTESTAKIKKAAGDASPALKPNADLTSDQKSDLAELGTLKGADFDKKYIDEQVEAHEDALNLMKKYASDGTAPTLKVAASEIAPIVETHFAHAKELDKD
jgi:putative membrane protein